MKPIVEKLSDQAYKVTVNFDTYEMTFSMHFAKVTTEAEALQQARSYADAFLTGSAAYPSSIGVS